LRKLPFLAHALADQLPTPCSPMQFLAALQVRALGVARAADETRRVAAAKMGCQFGGRVALAPCRAWSWRLAAVPLHQGRLPAHARPLHAC
jgi:hypothetical protein